MKQDADNDCNDDEYVVTSIRLRKSIRKAAKIYAASHDSTLQEIIDAALRQYLSDQDNL